MAQYTHTVPKGNLQKAYPAKGALAQHHLLALSITADLDLRRVKLPRHERPAAGHLYTDAKRVKANSQQ